jgi:uncharacterized membrane protein YhaH (DUF805 family)
MQSGYSKLTYDGKQLEVLTRLCEIAWTNFDRRRSHEWKFSISLWTALTAFIALILRKDVVAPSILAFCSVVCLIFGLQVIFQYFVKVSNKVEQEKALKYEKLLNRAVGEELEDARGKLLRLAKGWWAFVIHICVTLILILAAGFALYSNRNIVGEKVMSDSTGMFNVLIPVIVAVIAFGGALVTWCLNEKSKRSYEEYKRKEERYSRLIRSLRGFYVGSENTELKTEFLNQLNLCWMYCPDEVICKVYNFLNTVHTDQKHSDEEKEKAVGEIMLAIRRDLVSRKPLKATNLKPEDFKHLKAT